jgi:hypothetical protein
MLRVEAAITSLAHDAEHRRSMSNNSCSKGLAGAKPFNPHHKTNEREKSLSQLNLVYSKVFAPF